MTKEKYEEYVTRLKELIEISDYEFAHSEADKVLCDLLEQLGFMEIVETWQEVGKWYA